MAESTVCNNYAAAAKKELDYEGESRRLYSPSSEHETRCENDIYL